jgi:hypothetical protein
LLGVERQLVVPAALFTGSPSGTAGQEDSDENQDEFGKAGRKIHGAVLTTPKRIKASLGRVKRVLRSL